MAARSKILVGRKKKISSKPRYKSLDILSGIRINVLSIYLQLEFIRIVGGAGSYM